MAATAAAAAAGEDRPSFSSQKQLEDYLNKLLKMAMYRKYHHTVSNQRVSTLLQNFRFPIGKDNDGEPQVPLQASRGHSVNTPRPACSPALMHLNES